MFFAFVVSTDDGIKKLCTSISFFHSEGLQGGVELFQKPNNKCNGVHLLVLVAQCDFCQGNSCFSLSFATRFPLYDYVDIVRELKFLCRTSVIHCTSHTATTDIYAVAVEQVGIVTLPCSS